MKHPSKQSFVFFALCLILSSCGNSKLSPQDPNSFIDPSITGKDRQTLVGVIESLPENQRGNVIYINAKGDVLAAHPEEKVGLIRAEHVAGMQYKNLATGQLLAMPAPIDQQSIPSDKSVVSPLSTAPRPYCSPDAQATGAWSRSVTDNGFVAMTADLYLPSSQKSSTYKSRDGMAIPELFMSSDDTAYIYSGGWAGGVGSGVDAGLQYSATYNDWAPFVRVEKAAYIFGYSGDGIISNPPQLGTRQRFKGGEKASMEFTVEANRVRLFTKGFLANPDWPYWFWDYTYQQGRTIVVDLDPKMGWRADGYEVQLKRMTSIGQKGGLTLRKSYIFNVAWDNIFVARGLSYGNTVSGKYLPWTQLQSPSDGYRCYVPKYANPDQDHKVDIFTRRIRSTEGNHEQIDIDLRP